MKTLIIILFAFLAGFLTHALLFPDILANGITDVQTLVIPNAKPTTAAGKIDPLITKISFDGKQFSRHNVTVQFSRYIKITNNSHEKLMTLTSTNPQLTTPRGYGYSEAIEVRMDKKGQFVVADKNNPDEKLVITVK